MGNKQLFALHRAVELPSHAQFDPLNNRFHGVNEVMDAVFAMYWPDGSPCIYAEMFLLAKSLQLKMRSNDGGSLKVTASDLSHLVRFCWDTRCNFWDLYDDDFYNFVQRLRADKKHPGSAIRRRNDNTVSRIIETAIEFLIWIQSHFFSDRTIAGPRRIAPQIRLLEKSYRSQGGQYVIRLKYPFTPTQDVPDPKRPLSSSLRNRLWDGVRILSQRVQPNLDAFERNYLRARREVMFLLLEATGCRPGEAARLSVNTNENCVSTGTVTLVTLKRRKGTDPERRVPLDKATAIKLEVFIHKHRKELIKRLRARGIEVWPQDKVFLGCRTGKPIAESALIREFHRIVTAADVEERACPSMFRHRFITNMVKLHLLALMRDHPGVTRALLTEGDYRTILRRVATFTGHGSEESLFHYINWAWEELEVFDYVSSARALTSSVENAIRGLRDLSSQVTGSGESKSIGEAIQDILSELESIRPVTEGPVGNRGTSKRSR